MDSINIKLSTFITFVKQNCQDRRRPGSEQVLPWTYPGVALASSSLPSSMLQESKEDRLDISLRGKYTIDELEKDYIRKILIEVGGNKLKAAQILGLDRKTLYRKLEEL